MEIIKRIWKFLKYWLWTKPVQKPEKTPPPRIKAQEVAHAYIVVQYHGQRVNLHKEREYPVWKTYSRKEKRATAKGFEMQEKKGLIRFEVIDGHLICIKNKDYDKLAELAKEKK